MLLHAFSYFSFRQDLLSDEEAQEVTRLLSPNDTTKSSGIHNNILNSSTNQQDSLISMTTSTTTTHDSSGPISLNDSLGPPSLQEESLLISEPLDQLNESMTEFNQFNAKLQDVEPLSQFYESTSSIDISAQDEAECLSKFDASVSASDSGLIGKFCVTFLIFKWY